ncbi:MAG: alpha/beta hydrolase [Pirellulaceae bacterium]
MRTSIPRQLRALTCLVGLLLLGVHSGCGKPDTRPHASPKSPESTPAGETTIPGGTATAPGEAGAEPSLPSERIGPPRESASGPPTKKTEPVDLVPPETQPSETQPSETQPSETQPSETQPAEPTTAAVPDDPVAEERPLLPVGDQAATATDSQPPAANRAAASSAADPNLPCDVLTVFYATDRRPLEQEAATGASGRDWLPVAAGLLVALLLATAGVLRGQRRRMFGLAVLVLLPTVSWGFYTGLKNLERFRTAAQSGVRYGNQRGELQVGTCRVSIPWTHEVGQVEQPSLLRLEVRDDVRKHVVLHETNRQEDSEFYRQLRDQVLAASRPEVFVFVHGYNVTFEGAARRTAQIAFDVQFAGASVFFSWPSQGGLLQYTVDENNVEWAVPHLKQFLLEVTRRSGAQSVNLIAHSMGNRALTAALRELQLQLGEEAALFNQIILAAPDIDAEIFRRDLAPALVKSAERVTLYASSNDQALVASKRVHGYARAGDSGDDLVVIPGLETIDVSRLAATSLLGHSYYGSSNPILLDIRQLIEFALPAAQRPGLLPQSYGELTYWMFEKMRVKVVGNADPL